MAAAPFDRILVPLAGAGTGDRGLAVARRLARQAGVPVRTLHVAPPPGAAASGARAAPRAPAGPVRTGESGEVVGYGSVARAIADAVDPRTLVCMSSHGAYGPGHTLAGGVTDAVVRTAGVPVLLVGPHVPPDAGCDRGRVVACTDGSPLSERVLPTAHRWSRAFGLPLWLVEVTPPEGAAGGAGDSRDASGRRLAQLARSMPGVAGWRVVHDRHPARALAALAGAGPVALLVTAVHGRTGWSRVVTGSVTASVVRRAPVPVLVIPARSAVRAGGRVTPSAGAPVSAPRSGGRPARSRGR